jgi:Chaperone of endosialidase
MRRIGLMLVFALLELFGGWVAPVEAQLTGCVLSGPYAVSAFLTAGGEGELSGKLTFTPANSGSCSPGLATVVGGSPRQASPVATGTVTLELVLLVAGSPTPLPINLTLPYTVDPNGTLEIGPGIIRGMVGQLADTGIANGVALEADPAISPATIRFAGTALRLSANNSLGTNTVVGASALQANTTGGANTATGDGALFANSSGSSNTAMGFSALSFNTGGSGNIAIGESAGSNVVAGSNNIYIGTSGPADESNVIRIGAGAPSAFIAGIAGNPIAGDIVAVGPSGQLGTAILIPSSKRFKEDVRDMGDASAGLLRLRPVTFRYRPEYDDGTRRTRYGLIAEEVAEVFPALVQYTAAGEPQTVRYQELPALLLNEVQRLHRTVETAQQRITALEAQLAELMARLAGRELRDPATRAE